MVTQSPWGPLKALIERFDEHNFGRTEIQRLVENADTLVQIGKGTLTRDVISPIIAQVVNPFAKEKREPILHYPDGWQLKGIDKQILSLKEFYPDLDGSHVYKYVPNLTGLEETDGGSCVAVFPKLGVVAKAMNIADPFDPEGGYGELIEKALCARLGQQRPFKNWRAGELKSYQVQMRESTVNALRKLEEEQPEGDFLVVPVQTGKKYAGYSVRNSRWEMEHGTTEFLLPAWVIGHLLITHQERLAKYEDLCIDCPGDEYKFEPSDEFENCLYFYFNDGQLHFRSRWIENVSDNFGSASGFLR